MPRKPPKHNAQPRSGPEATRGGGHRLTTAQRGYGGRWQRYRLAFLQANPLCVLCLAKDRTTAATVVDHKTPHKGDRLLFWAPGNHQALCKPCHDHKTVTEDGGFGRAVVATVDERRTAQRFQAC